jgi:hypothetical protein
MSLLVGCGWPRRRSFNYFFNGMFVCSSQFSRFEALKYQGFLAACRTLVAEKKRPALADGEFDGTRLMR